MESLAWLQNFSPDIPWRSKQIIRNFEIRRHKISLISVKYSYQWSLFTEQVPANRPVIQFSVVEVTINWDKPDIVGRGG